MQTSGTFPQLSDGVKKTVTTCVPAPAAPRRVDPRPPGDKKDVPMPKPAANPHRRGGYAKHAKAGK